MSVSVSVSRSMSVSVSLCVYVVCTYVLVVVRSKVLAKNSDYVGRIEMIIPSCIFKGAQ